MNPAQWNVLNTIAAGEAPDYNTMYGGHKFTSFQDHPNIPIPIGKTGLFSTAAGRYQLLKSTWDKAKNALGLKSFSPDNQDAAAWWWANKNYGDLTGRDLEQDSQDGSVQWNALEHQWPSLHRLVGKHVASGPPPMQPVSAAGSPAGSASGGSPGFSILDQMRQGGLPSLNFAAPGDNSLGASQ